jgi:hypothetical protein
MSIFVSDYFSRLVLRKAGFHDSIKDLDFVERQIFCIIAGELSKMEQESMEKARKKRGK